MTLMYCRISFIYVFKVVKLIETDNKVVVSRGRGKGRGELLQACSVSVTQDWGALEVRGTMMCLWLTILFCTLGNLGG